jgi:Leucine-rich repeat (LRR) protein
VFAIVCILEFTNVGAYFLLPPDCPLSCRCEIISINKLKLVCAEIWPPFYRLPSDFQQYPDLKLSIDTTINGDVEFFPFNLCDYEKLITVRVEYTKIRTLSPGLLTCLKSLTFLYLNYNEIIEIKKHYFNSIQNLFILELSNNKIASIENEAFNNLPNLFKLDLSNNNIHTIGSNPFNNMLFLSLIYLPNNQIEEILSDWFKDLPFLSQLVLSNNKIKDIGESFKNINSLTDLDLSNNLITQIKLDSLRHIDDIMNLNISNNRLTELELWPLYLSKIENVDLRNNLIQKFSNKQEFYVQKTNLPAFSDSTLIDLSNNLIETFDDKTLEIYGVFELNGYETFVSKYFKAFVIYSNPVECNCSIQQRIIEYSSKLKLNKSFLIKCKNSVVSVFDQNCKIATRNMTSSVIASYFNYFHLLILLKVFLN